MRQGETEGTSDEHTCCMDGQRKAMFVMLGTKDLGVRKDIAKAIRQGT